MIKLIGKEITHFFPKSSNRSNTIHLFCPNLSFTPRPHARPPPSTCSVPPQPSDDADFSGWNRKPKP